MQEKAKEPEIRFAGFTGAWEQRKLSNIADIVGGGTPSTSNPDYWDGDIDWYTPAEIGEQIFAYGSVRKITKEGLIHSSAKILPAHKTVLFTSRAGIGNMAILKRSAATNQGFQSLVCHDDIDPYFMFSMGDSIKAKAERVAAGSTFAEISGKKLGELEFMFPDTDEQKAIGAYFKNLDNLITLHQRKYEKLLNIKKSMLEKMFPKEGEVVPEIRFKGFTGAWEQRKFCEIAKRLSETATSDSTNPCVEYENIISGSGTLNKNIFLKSANKKGIKFSNTDVLYGKLRPYLHNWLCPDFTGVAVGDWWVLHPINADREFLYRLIQTQQYDEICNQSAGSKMPRADWNLVSNVKFYIPPTLLEQQKIGKYFESVDTLITLHQRKLEMLKNVKRAFLEKMFV